MRGTFQQVETSVRSLMDAAMDGAEAARLRVAVDALRDQWLAAERASRDDHLASLARFDVVAAMLYGEAFRPAILAVAEGQDATEELDRAIGVARWIGRAHHAFSAGSEPVLNLCLRRAERAVNSLDELP